MVVVRLVGAVVVMVGDVGRCGCGRSRRCSVPPTHTHTHTVHGVGMSIGGDDLEVIVAMVIVVNLGGEDGWKH